jgi:predicted ATPase
VGAYDQLVTSPRAAAPAARTTFFGRERELAHLRELLRREPLVTITGLGGAGKTRLAAEATSGPDAPHADDVRWCVLTALDDDAAVADAVADALGRDGGADAVVEALNERPRLLVLDNCEHVLAGAIELVDRILDDCPDAGLLATSREPLGVDGEHMLQLGPLGLPEGDDLEALERSEAVALFADRARAVRWDFELGPENAEAVARICRRLDGLPLAIELAAARSRSRSAAEIAEHLDERFSLLTRPRSREGERHRTLRATIDWSYRLLSEPERLALDRMGVFAGRFDLDAAGEICAGEGVERAEMLDLLDSLVRRSLLVASEEDGGMRYGMLESIRHYALERLAERGDEARVRSLHVDYFAARADSMRRDAEAFWSSELLRAGIRAFDEVRAAALWSIRHDESRERAFTLVASLWPLCHSLHAAEIASLCRQALERWPDVHDALGQEALGAAAVAEFTSGQASLAAEHARSAIAAERDDAPPAALARRAVALVTYGFLGDVEDGLERIDDAVQAAWAAAMPAVALEMSVLRSQALAAAGRYDEAVRVGEAARREAGRMESPYMLAWVLYTLGTVLKSGGDPRATACFTESLRLARENDSYLVIGSSMRQLAALAIGSGRDPDAAGLLVRAYEHFTSTGDRPQRWDVLRTSAPLLSRRGRRELAARVLAGAEADPRARRPAALEADALAQLGAELAGELRAASLTPPLLEDVGPAVVGELRALDAPAAAAPAPEASAPGRVFRHEGELWRLSYDGADAHLPDLKGLHDLVRLLAAPGEEVHCLELAAGPAAPPARAPAAEDGLGMQGHAGELLDERARTEFRRRIEDLREDLELAEAANDPLRVERARAELDAVTAALASAFGLAGRARKAGDPAERARSAVTWRIRSALAKVGAAHPALGAHLRNSVSTGTFCCYRPERPVDWLL